MKLTPYQERFLQHMRNLYTLGVCWEKGVFIVAARDARTIAVLVHKGALVECSVDKGHPFNGVKFPNEERPHAK